MMHDPDSGKAPSRGTGGLTSATTLPILPPDTDVPAAALAYAASDWPVFPCWESGEHAKAPRTPNGFKDATTDPEQVGVIGRNVLFKIGVCRVVVRESRGD